MITPTGPVSSSGRFPPEQQGLFTTSLPVGTNVSSESIEFKSYSAQTVAASGSLPKGLYYTSNPHPVDPDIELVNIVGTPIEPDTTTFTATVTNDISSTVSNTSFTTTQGTVGVSGYGAVYTAYGTNRTIWWVVTTSTITITGHGSMYFLLIAGGGGGGGDGNGAGGGGAGEVLYGKVGVTAGNYNVTIGAGGAGGSGPSSNGSNGSNSYFAGRTVRGGGYGGKFGTTGGLVSSGTNGGGGGGFASARTGAAADGGAGGFYNGGGGGSSRSDLDDFGTQPYSRSVNRRYSTINDGSNGNASPSETGGNGGAATWFYNVWSGTSSFPVGGGGGGGGGSNGGLSYSGSSSFSGGYGRGAAYGNGYGSNGYYYGQGGGGGYYGGGSGRQGILLLWAA